MSNEIEYMTRATACGKESNYTLIRDRLSTSTDIRGDYREGYYFSPSTLDWFGSVGFETVAPGASVELQENAPGAQYRAQLWRVGDDGSPSPWFGCYHGSRAQAVACARATARLLA